ncbi:hypothetical protein [Micromonospora sp. DT31]|uniref:hypothetical protein n=1 Tax=Micromonospora sp. DT31 TaxID=3393434 RepID=UPI003CF3D11B
MAKKMLGKVVAGAALGGAGLLVFTPGMAYAGGHDEGKIIAKPYAVKAGETVDLLAVCAQPQEHATVWSKVTGKVDLRPARDGGHGDWADSDQGAGGWGADQAPDGKDGHGPDGKDGHGPDGKGPGSKGPEGNGPGGSGMPQPPADQPPGRPQPGGQPQPGGKPAGMPAEPSWDKQQRDASEWAKDTHGPDGKQAHGPDGKQAHGPDGKDAHGPGGKDAGPGPAREDKGGKPSASWQDDNHGKNGKDGKGGPPPAPGQDDRDGKDRGGKYPPDRPGHEEGGWEQGKDFVYYGEATVSKDARPGRYELQGTCGEGELVVLPHGGVDGGDGGMSPTGVDRGLATGGAGMIGVAALGGLVLLRRRRANGSV